MPHLRAYALLGLLFLIAIAAHGRSALWDASSTPAHVAPRASAEAAPMCPWRRPAADLATFFPTATGHQTETLILSGARLELTRRLGRVPSAEENALYQHRIYEGSRRLGTVLTRRVKGEYGAIEIVLAVDSRRSVRGLRYQRLREPLPIDAAIRSPHWLAAFSGKTAAGDWHLGRGIPAVPTAARISAQAVVEGVRSLLVLQETAEQRGLRIAEPHHHS